MKSVATTKTNLSVRPLTAADIRLVVDYWCDMPNENLLRMGAERDYIPSREEFTANLLHQLTTTDRNATSFVLMWLADGEPIGFNTLKNIRYGEDADIHLHIFDDRHRGKGYGAPLFCLATVEYYRRFALQSMMCEPRSANPMPNGMLRKVGFPLIKTYVGRSSAICGVCELNRYDIRRDVAERFLEDRDAR